MARIKFLDILEETKTNPAVSDFTPTQQPQAMERDFSGMHDRFLKKERVFEKSTPEPLTPRREPRTTRNPRLSFDSVNRGGSIASAPVKQSINFEDSRILWTGALFVFFGSVLFLSGYWFGKSVTSSVKQESLTVLNEASQDFRREELNTMSVADLPVIKPVEPVAEPVAKKPIKVVEPAVAPQPVVKKAPAPVPVTKEYVIQVSTHSSMDSARQVEDTLRAAGFSAYTSESMVGNAMYFRVRIRGFSDKAQADKVLAEVKSIGMGTDGYVLTLD